MNRWLKACASLLGTGYLIASAVAHEGEDHSHNSLPPPTLTQVLAPRLEAASRDIELLAILEQGELTVYLDRYASNEPVEGATIAVDVNNQTHKLVPVDPGVYRLAGASGLNTPGSYELVFTLEAGTLSDVLIGTLTVPTKAEPPATRGVTLKTDLLLLGGAGIIGLLAGLALRRRRPPLLMLWALVLPVLTLPVPVATAHEGEDHGAARLPPLPDSTSGAPTRLPDGSLFVSKPVQRLLGIRTFLAAIRDTPKAMELNGHLIADPNHSGRVQATQAGRIEPAPQGLPHLGQTVRAGQVLAYLVPVAATLETANQQAQLADLSSQINLTERRLARLQQLAGSVAQREIDEARTELEGLRKRRTAVGSGLSLREPLRAPVDGVISAASAMAGQVVEARETLFEVINPRQWWVEAVVYDASLSERISSALAQTFDGQTLLPLRLLGMGYQRRSQGLPLQFGIEGESVNLSAGQPVRILAQTRETVRGVLVPRDSVVRDSSGETLVWIHPGAERFAPRRVRVQAVDGATLVVTEGLSAGDRIVGRGATILAQVR